MGHRGSSSSLAADGTAGGADSALQCDGYVAHAKDLASKVIFGALGAIGSEMQGPFWKEQGHAVGEKIAEVGKAWVDRL